MSKIPFELPPEFPEPGFYYNYKHDPEGPINAHAYEVLGPGYYAGDDPHFKGRIMVVYRPLYKDAFVYKNGRGFDMKLLNEFLNMVPRNGTHIARYEKIIDEKAVAVLTRIRNEMYG
jgi:hypothetical protein